MSTQPAVQESQLTTDAAEEPKKNGKPIPEETVVGFGSAASFVLLQREAMILSASSLVPKEFQNNLPNCVIALNMAQRMGADPLMVMQNLYVVYGRPGWSSQFLIATFNQNGRYSALRYEFCGEPGKDSYGCRAWSIEKDTGEKLEGSWVTVEIAKKEGWYNRKAKSGESASKWPTMTQQMLMYRAASWFIRAHAPEIAMGLKTTEELIDAGPELVKEIVERTEAAAKLREAVEGAPSKLDALVDAEEAKTEEKPEPKGEGNLFPERESGSDDK